MKDEDLLHSQEFYSTILFLISCNTFYEKCLGDRPKIENVRKIGLQCLLNIQINYKNERIKRLKHL